MNTWASLEKISYNFITMVLTELYLPLPLALYIHNLVLCFHKNHPHDCKYFDQRRSSSSQKGALC